MKILKELRTIDRNADYYKKEPRKIRVFILRGKS